MSSQNVNVWLNDYLDDQTKAELIADLREHATVVPISRPPIGGGGISSIIEMLWQDPVVTAVLAQLIANRLEAAWKKPSAPPKPMYPDPASAHIRVTNGTTIVEHTLTMATPEDRRYAADLFGRTVEEMLSQSSPSDWVRIEFDVQTGQWKEKPPPTKG